MGKNSKIGPIDDPGLTKVRNGLKIQDDWVSFKVQRHPKKILSVFHELDPIAIFGLKFVSKQAFCGPLTQ